MKTHNPSIQTFFTRAAMTALTLLILSSATSWAATSTVTFATPGNYNWKCPAGVASIQIECWGGGGGGGGCGAIYTGAGGGAGGSYVRYSVSVTPGTVYNLTVGAGGTNGAEGAGGTATGGGTGGSSYFGNASAGSSAGASVLAVGGSGGAADNTAGSSSSNYHISSGGTGTTNGNVPASIATYDYAGSNGTTGPGTTKGSGAGGSGAGASGSSGGGAGGAALTSTGNGTPGTVPGGGGGGGDEGSSFSASSGAGGAGGAGQVAITANVGPFAPGNIVVERLGDGIESLSGNGNTMFMDEFVTNGSPVQSIKIDDSSSSALIDSGTAKSDGGMTLSADGRFLCFPGYNIAQASSSSTLTASASSSVPRGIGIVGATGTYTLAATSTTAFNNNNIRGAATDGNTNFWGSGNTGSGGIYYFGSNSPAADVYSQNLICVNIFGGNLWYDTASSPPGYGIWEYSGTPTTAVGNTATKVITLGSGDSPYNFSVNSSATVIYYADDNTGIHKWTNGPGGWGQQYIVYPAGVYGLLVDWTTTPATIYATTGSGASANNLVRVVDNGAGSSATTLATAPASEIYRGIAFAPVSYAVTYNANGGSGSVPTDGNAYTNGATVTVPGNTGNMTLTGYAFAGWTNVSGTTYSAGSTFTISSNTTFYAKWAPTYTVTYNGNGSTGGSPPVDNNAYTNGQTVTVLGNTNGLVKSGGYNFGGWTTNSSGSGTVFNANSTFSMPAVNTTLYAHWTTSPSISINGGSGASLNFGAVLTNTTSASQYYTVSGANLTGNILINAPASFKISTDNTAFSSSLTLTPSGTTLASTNIYVQFNPTAVSGYSGTGITNTSSGATEQDVAVAGFGAAVPLVSTQEANPTNTTSATLNGTVTSSNNAAILDRGFFWKISPGVTTSDNQLSEGGTSVSVFSKVLNGLNANTNYYYRAYASNSIGITLDTFETNFCTLANTPAAPLVGSPATSSLNVAIGPGDGNPSTTMYAILATSSFSTNYVNADGSLGATAVYQTADNWGNTMVTGLHLGTAYSFMVNATNGAGVPTAFGPATIASTLNVPFTAGDIAVLSADNAGANNSTFSIIELNPAAASQTAVQTFSINGTSGNPGGALRISGSASTSPKLADSGDRTFLVFAGFNTTNSIGAANTNLLRGVGTLNVSGDYALQTTYTGTNGNPVRGAATVDNNTWYVYEGTSGIYTNGGTVPLITSNIYSMKSFGGTNYALQQAKGSVAVSAVSANGTTLSGLSGLARDSSAVDFYMISSGNNGTTFDVLYVLDETNATDGVIDKYSLVTGSWTANGSYSNGYGGFGLAAATNGGGGVSLYVTTGDGTVAANSVIELTDNNGWNSAINITTANNVTNYTAAAGTTIKGIAFVPVKAASSTALTSSLNPSPMGSNVTFVATVGGNSGTPTGTVQFKTNGVALGGAVTLSASGTATNSTALLPAGTTTIAAEYSGDSNYLPGTNTLAQVIIPPPVANPATYSRAAGTALKISVTNLLAQFTGDANGYARGLMSVSGGLLTNNMVIATTTNGSSVYYANPYAGSDYIILTPTNNLNESFSYVVNDNIYPSLMATNLITISVTNAVGQATGNIIANLAGGSITTTWAGVVGDNYVVQRATNMPATTWTDIWPTNNVPGVFSFTDTFSDLGHVPPQAYYRLRSN